MVTLKSVGASGITPATGAAAAGGRSSLGFERAGGTFFEELAPDFREHGEGEHILFALGNIADLFAQSLHLGLEPVRRTAADDFRHRRWRACARSR